MTEHRPKPDWQKRELRTFLRFNSISLCNDMEGTNLSLSVHLELTFSITIKIKLCLSGDAGVSVKEKFYREAKVQKLLN